MTTDPTEHEIAAELVLTALDGPRGPEVATTVIHTWLMRPAENVPQEMIDEIVGRWPYAAQIAGLLGQVERLSLLEHWRLQEVGLNPADDAKEMITIKARQFLIHAALREYLQKTITDENARKTLGL